MKLMYVIVAVLALWNIVLQIQVWHQIALHDDLELAIMWFMKRTGNLELYDVCRNEAMTRKIGGDEQ